MQTPDMQAVLVPFLKSTHSFDAWASPVERAWPEMPRFKLETPKEPRLASTWATKSKAEVGLPDQPEVVARRGEAINRTIIIRDGDIPVQVVWFLAWDERADFIYATFGVDDPRFSCGAQHPDGTYTFTVHVLAKAVIT